MSLQAEQIERERAAREAALGMRLRSVDRGDLGPALRRWVTGSIVPVSERLRGYAKASCSGAPDDAGAFLSSHLFGLPEAHSSPSLRPIFEWLLKGNSTGFSGDATYAEDIVLAGLGTAVLQCTRQNGAVPLTRCINDVAEAIRATVIGQFLTTVQGAKALQAVRSGKDHEWQENKQLDAVATLMVGQVRSALGGQPTSQETKLGGRQVVSVLNEAGKLRQITLRRPDKNDWAVLEMARHPIGDTDRDRSTWFTLGMLILCAAQAEAGWFDLVAVDRAASKRLRDRRPMRKATGIVLSEPAVQAIQGDLKKWLQMGFVREPMVVKPDNGDYMTVKHRSVLGAPGPKGNRTNAEGTTAWNVSCASMADTGWLVAQDTLKAVQSDGPLADAAVACEPDSGRRSLLLASYARAAGTPIYFPIRMDFRGRVYLQTPFVTYQGKDLQKGLLRFPVADDISTDAGELPAFVTGGEEAQEERRRKAHRDAGLMPGYVRDIILPLHLGALYGGPDKLDKAPLPARQAWLRSSKGTWLAEADDPVQLYTALNLLEAGEWDCIPCQIDGTCNGLQHLSAMFRDETAAPLVNLTASTYDQAPADIYGRVAERVSEVLAGLRAPWASRVSRLVTVDRKLCKSPVMVLPYGGVKTTIEDAILDAIIGQYDPGKNPMLTPLGISPWHECLYPNEHGDWVRDEEALAGNYLAFRERDLANHPLLHLDAKRLGTIVWGVIEETLPRPIQAMAAFRALAKAVGPRTWEWTPGYHRKDELPLWVVQAKSKSARSTLKLKGLHLPKAVRGLKIRVGRDEIDPGAHTSGIVANFIHSQDADHQTRTAVKFMNWGGKDFGAIFDCYITRPSQMPLLQRAARQAFAEKYNSDNHPLAQPVRLRDIATGAVEEHVDWFRLADHYGVDFPQMGKWNPKEVLDSAWFFS